MTQTIIKRLLYNTASVQNLCRTSLILNRVRFVLWAHYSNATVPQLKFLYFIMAELQILKKQTNKLMTLRHRLTAQPFPIPLQDLQDLTKQNV